MQRVEMTRDYLYSSTDVLSKEREEKVVRRTLQQELVNLAILRITAAAR
jgi:outer membrane lipopolysaccharide assembly protein LptE/RlpB